jgi:hypothetical protein
MTLAEQLTTDLPVFFDTDDFARTVTYNGAEISAIVDYGVSPDGENARTARLIVKVSDVPDPAYRDTVVIGSATFRVFRDPGKEVAVKGDGHVWELSLVRDERPVW